LRRVGGVYWALGCISIRLSAGDLRQGGSVSASDYLLDCLSVSVSTEEITGDDNDGPETCFLKTAWP